MEENLVQNWIDSDKALYNLITEIEATNKSFPEQAELAFEKLSELYNIPRMPSDINDEELDEDEEFEDDISRSLFEEHALLKYLAGKFEDPRSIVLSAAFHLLNDYRVELLQVAIKEFGKNIPENCKIGIKGDGFHGEVVFPQKETESWYDLGCIVMTQIN